MENKKELIVIASPRITVEQRNFIRKIAKKENVTLVEAMRMVLDLAIYSYGRL